MPESVWAISFHSYIMEKLNPSSWPRNSAATLKDAHTDSGMSITWNMINNVVFESPRWLRDSAAVLPNVHPDFCNSYSG